MRNNKIIGEIKMNLNLEEKKVKKKTRIKVIKKWNLLKNI